MEICNGVKTEKPNRMYTSVKNAPCERFERGMEMGKRLESNS